MLQLRAALSAAELDAIAELERRTVSADGGRLKLEWGVLNSRRDDHPHDLLWWQDGRLVGFLGRYAFDGRNAELAGMVDPSARRRGIGSALLDAAQRLVGERGYEQTLLICPRSTTSGAAFAAQRGAGLAHSEHALQLTGAPIHGPKDAAVSLRAATADDASTIARLLQAGFGYPAADVAQRLVEDRARNLVVERAGTTVGYLRLSLDGTVGGVYGFVIDPPLQGHGIGRDVLHRACLMLRELGATHVGLEVGVTNERALGLYTSLGFVRVSTEDYFHLPPSHG